MNADIPDKTQHPIAIIRPRISFVLLMPRDHAPKGGMDNPVEGRITRMVMHPGNGS